MATSPVTVEVRKASSLPYASFLKEYVTPGRPVVVRGGIEAWPAMTKWTPEFFKRRFGSKLVEIGYDSQMPFDRFIDEVLASTVEKPGPYMYRLFLHQHLPELLSDLSPQNPYGFPRRHASPLMLRHWRRPDGYLKLLIGGVGGKFPIMHFDGDNAHATITEIYGDKEFILYPPTDSDLLYPNPQKPNQSSVNDPVDIDFERFPLAERATRHRVVLTPGDTVFVPCRWWHTARALTVSISVCTNIVDASNWAGYIDEVTDPRRGHPAKQLLKRAYLNGLGRVLGAMEKVQERFPAATRANRLLGLIAPATAEHARDPSNMRIHIEGPTY